jgi:hypothetical protein
LHAFKDNLKLKNEIEQLSKVTKDYKNVKMLIEENEKLKKENTLLKEANY